MNMREKWLDFFVRLRDSWTEKHKNGDNPLVFGDVPDEEIENHIRILDICVKAGTHSKNFFVLNHALCIWYLNIVRLLKTYLGNLGEIKAEQMIIRFAIMQEAISSFCDESKKILVIGTGGTLSCEKKHGALVPTYSVEELVKLEPASFHVSDNLIFEDVMQIDSSEMAKKPWIKLTNAIEKLAKKHKPHGIVVLHGSDQLVETASFLSFAFEKLNIPIILTASMTQAVKEGKRIFDSHAWQNILDSLLVASEGDFAEVCICVNGIILRGTRAYHMEQKEKWCFVGYKEGQEHGIGLINDSNLIEYKDDDRIKKGENKHFPEPNIDVLKTHYIDVRGQKSKDILALKSRRNRFGLVLASDSGNFPRASTGVNQLASEGYPCMITSRVPGSKTFPLYRVAEGVSDEVIFCKDMLASVTWIKSWFVIKKAKDIFGKCKDKTLYQQIVKELMLKNFVGEIQGPRSEKSLKEIEFKDL